MTNTYPHVVSTPGVRGGRPCIEDTRISVLDIVGLHLQGVPPEAMLDRYMTHRPLTLADVHAALTYYYDHQAELDAIMAADRELFDEGLAAQEKRDRER